MKNIKIIKLLKTFSKEEIREFGKFIRSPLNKGRKDVIRLFDVLSIYHPSYLNRNLNNEVIFKQLYSGRQYEKTIIHKLYSFLYSLGKEFLILCQVKKDKYYSHYFLLKELEERKSDYLFQAEFKHIDNLLEREQFDTDFLERKVLLQRLNCEFYQDRQIVEKYEDLLYKKVNDLIYFFIYNLICDYSNMINHKTTQNNNYQIADFEFLKSGFINQLLNNVKNVNPEYYDYLSFYYFLLMCTIEPENDLYYSKMKECLLGNNDRLSVKELSHRFPHIESYCMRRLLKGETRFFNELFDLYRLELEKIPSPVQFATFFRNTIIIGLTIKQYSDVEKFINDYSHKLLMNENGADILSICNAMFYFELKDYARSLDWIAKVTDSYDMYVCDSKTLYVKIYYEMKVYESLFSQIDTFTHYLKTTNTLPEERLLPYKVFLNYTLKLARLKTTNTETDLSFLTNEIKNNNIISLQLKPWLLEKADELGIS